MMYDNYVHVSMMYDNYVHVSMMYDNYVHVSMMYDSYVHVSMMYDNYVHVSIVMFMVYELATMRFDLVETLLQLLGLDICYMQHYVSFGPSLMVSVLTSWLQEAWEEQT